MMTHTAVSVWQSQAQSASGRTARTILPHYRGRPLRSAIMHQMYPKVKARTQPSPKAKVIVVAGLIEKVVASNVVVTTMGNIVPTTGRKRQIKRKRKRNMDVPVLEARVGRNIQTNQSEGWISIRSGKCFPLLSSREHARV